MPTPLPLEELLRGWTAPPLGPAWIEVVRRTLEALRPPFGRVSATSPRPLAAVEAWAELGTLFGDSGAPELCAVVLRHGLSLLSAPDGTDAAERRSERLRAGLHLALADLGLATAKTPNPLRGAGAPVVEVEERGIALGEERLGDAVGLLDEGALELAEGRRDLAERPGERDVPAAAVAQAAIAQGAGRADRLDTILLPL